MKYRIKQIDNYYYPQCNRLFFWNYYEECRECPYDTISKIYFLNLVDAEEFILKQVEFHKSMRRKKVVKIHNIPKIIKEL